jgi:hypothetical protein
MPPGADEPPLCGTAQGQGTGSRDKAVSLKAPQTPAEKDLPVGTQFYRKTGTQKGVEKFPENLRFLRPAQTCAADTAGAKVLPFQTAFPQGPFQEGGKVFKNPFRRNRIDIGTPPLYLGQDGSPSVGKGKPGIGSSAVYAEIIQFLHLFHI